jgi:hypothetical protein
MKIAFLLRFQESCPQGAATNVSVGTETLTFVRSEQSDADPHNVFFRAMPTGLHVPRKPANASLGTQASTAVGREAADCDPATRRFEILPQER